MRVAFVFAITSLLLPRFSHALVGFLEKPYYPLCAYACGRCVWSNLLSCSDPAHPDTSMMDNTPDTSSKCLASDTSYLSTLAYCLSIKCASYQVMDSTINQFWETEVTGDAQLQPKWTYAQTLEQISTPPTRVLGGSDVLNYTALVNDTVWTLQYNTLASVYDESAFESKVGVAVMAAGVGLPVVLTWLGYLPYITRLSEWLKPYIIYPATIGTYHVRPLPYRLGNAPTMGQSLYIAFFVGLNIILAAINYKVISPHAWYANKHFEIIAYVCWRTGCLALASLPLTLLFSSRNNILLWMTNWSHSTYMLLHRWVARVFGVHVLLHSILGLALYSQEHVLVSEEKMTWYIWGIVATLTTTIMLFASGLYVRIPSYEFFLFSHIVLAIFTIIGTWYHVILLNGYNWGYPEWFYIPFAIWGFDRILRVLRILKHGVRRAIVTDVGGGYVRVDVRGVRWSAEPGKHVYAYFPTLNPLRPWQNHPFSVLPTSLLRSYRHTSSTTPSIEKGEKESSEGYDIERHPSTSSSLMNGDTTSGITLFIKKMSGTTSHLTATDNLMTLLDGPYPNNSTRSVLRCDRLLLIGGGIGITGLLPYLNVHPNVKLSWSVRSDAAALPEALSVALDSVKEKDVRVGQRVDIKALLEEEVLCGWEKIGVVVCGPGGLCDDVRAAVVAAARKGPSVFKLEVDAFSW